jgi:hypothetical protein
MDQNSPQLPVPPTDAQVLTFGQKIKADIGYLWDHEKIFLVIFGVLILAGKFTSMLMDYIAYSSKKTLDKAVQQDGQLKKEEDAANNQANALVDEAKKLPSQEAPVTEDWYKKK